MKDKAQALNGHDSLLFDALSLIRSVHRYDFHDFKSNIAGPKMELVRILDHMLRCAKNGRYDNKADDEDKLNLKKIMEDEGSFSPEMIRQILYDDN